MFEGFTHTQIRLSEAVLNVRYGGNGPPVLLLHGHPRTHVTWSKVAPQLAESFTVVCPDLRGFGRSSKPADEPNHAGSSKRAKAKDCIELMSQLGFDQFALVGHDRGSYTAYRAALDYPERITRLAVLDCIPILEALNRCNEKFARQWYHWFFFAQPEKPEMAILADPDKWYGGQPETMGNDEYIEFRRAIHDPETVHGMIEDYRAGLTIDKEHELYDRQNGRLIECPTLCLWSKYDDLEDIYGDVLGIWKSWAPHVRGKAIASGHHMAEEAPEEVTTELRHFLLHENP
ncbi:alpha/beta hydrolase [Pantoea agglomerans]|jgi:haloacetate dehalogenase|uniref:Haloacetate dehalogenase n=1 Tax=[Curtobacterium] plantarum TaxID=221276 RepID=A0ABT9T8D8_9GAMM|nr:MULTISPECIES: alpha/beta hydrolase [Pantoea]KPA04768.1 Fluoroacetate dehalogenase [Pantoea agglomerans]MBO0636568.1 alpha/beta hydrolase [Pantoea agglomerans]MDQ0019722.1 haloacetate dehalogenase [[Curtobacterium] plantarum]MDQ0435104.1 haloacetate dehalogenase [Pantoea agglomerans]RAH31156.1 alpha/beta hydrolase [Pantoea agglomerans]